MKLYKEIDQRSEVWDQLRAGIPTASEFDRVLREYGKKGDQTAQNIAKIEKYAYRKVAELFLKRPVKKELFTRSMEWGQIQEESAVGLYELTYGLKTEKIGFVTTDNGWYGASPDRFVEGNGMCEMKAPDEDTHISYMIDPQKLADAYEHQTQGQLFVCDERNWNDLYSYHPEMPPVVIRVTRDKEYQERLAADLENFRAVQNSMIENLVQKGYMTL